ncbi:MAG: tRNA preQ1(34) S-adenosylmethionine ribosyltransferase-isomerase QueA [Actinobacteria bacterium]|nr:tRNA preQ1(34) S-adenosylmethionine ribosyltransferase-isomerase QueA [Actinomycetota bacterium]
MKSDLFFYNLPKSYIAQTPLEKRDCSKMMVLDRKSGRIIHKVFSSILEYLNPGDVLVLNESRVANCRICGIKEVTGARIECFVLKKTSNETYEVLLKPSKRLKKQDRVVIGQGRYFYDVIEKLQYGRAEVKFNAPAEEVMKKYGSVPLPPYITGKNIPAERYQTVYARKEGSAAAPTAGFHFTDELIKKINEKGVFFAKLCLQIGLDTFRPIIEENVEDHVIHSEKFSISAQEASNISEAKQKGGKVIAVGTTSTRVLETVMEREGRLKECAGETSLYIYPGYNFRIVDCMITNFHLPCSTLLVMVSAFAGRQRILNAYEEAKRSGYRFYSFGDCMFII